MKSDKQKRQDKTDPVGDKSNDNHLEYNEKYGKIMTKTTKEQIEFVKTYGNIGTAQSFRARVLDALEFPKAKKTAENLILFGCYPPFTSGLVLRDLMKLFEILEIDYTYLENEYCCGAPMILNCRGQDREMWLTASKSFGEKNRKMAEEKAAKTISYFCVGCVHYNKSHFPGEADRHLYLLDIILDKLGNRQLEIAAPKVVGYFPGCHSTYRKKIPGVSIDWEAYRRLLSRVKNLTVVDLPVTCCRDNAERIVENAEKLNLDTIVFPCNSCYLRVRPPAKGRVRVKHYIEIALKALQGE